MGVEPKRYRARFIEPGVISYEDVGQGLVFVSREALDKMRPSFVGMPVFNMSHKDIDAESAFDLTQEQRDNLADGIISAVGTDPDGWDWAEMLIWDEETQKNIDVNGFTVSCAYDILKTAPSGKHNGIEFDNEVKDGKYVHMAIVDSPRYEGSTVVHNAKGGKTMAKGFWKWSGAKAQVKNAEPSEDEKKAAEAKKAEELKAAEAAKKNAEGGEPDGDEGGYATIEGQKVPISKLVDAYMASKAENAGGEMSPEDEVELPNGEKCTVADLMKAYQGNKENATAGTAEGEPGTEAGGAVVKNAKGEKEPPNGHFIKVKNAASKVDDKPKIEIETRSDRLKNGASRYGSLVPASAKKEGE